VNLDFFIDPPMAESLASSVYAGGKLTMDPLLNPAKQEAAA
jgi:hypothetical protein